MATEKIGIYRKYYGTVPVEELGLPLATSECRVCDRCAGRCGDSARMESASARASKAEEGESDTLRRNRPRFEWERVTIMKRRVIFSFLISWFAASATPAAPLDAQQPDFQTATRAHDAIRKGLAFLVAGQQPDGGWEMSGKSNPAVTALVIKALAQDKDYGPRHPAVRRGLDYVMTFVHPDGGIYVEDQGLNNYHTSVALMALASMKDSGLAGTVKEAQNYLKKLQWDEGEGYESSSPWYGGQGYGSGKRPDLSNTQMMLEALNESGLPPDDPVYKKALVFVQRCQMLGETNDQPFAKGATDGGFVYSPANEGESKAGTETGDSRPHLRSYGSMTYAGFKSMLYAKVDRDDPRVKAAVEWIRRYYTLDSNPNMPVAQSKEGLYYYYHVFARAMEAFGEETITDHQGAPHRWRSELCEKLVTLQHADGSWYNDADRWMEGNPHLVTAYSVLALQTALGE